MRSLARLISAPSAARSAGPRLPIPRSLVETEPFRPRNRARTSISSWSERADAKASSASATIPRSSAADTLPSPARGRLGELGQRTERARVRDGENGQVLAIDLEPGFHEPAVEAAVGEPVRPRPGVDARDPEAPELALALLAVAVGVLPAALDGLAGNAHEPVAAAEVALGVREDLVVAPLARDAALDSGHGRELLDLEIGDELIQPLLVAGGDHVLATELALPLRALLGEDVSLVALCVPELAARRALEALGRAAVALHLRHGSGTLLRRAARPPPGARPPLRRGARPPPPPGSAPAPSRGSVRSSAAAPPP